MQNHLAFSEPIVGEIVVDVRDNGVGPLRGRAGLVTQVVHLAFSEPIVGEIVVDVRDNGVGPLRGRPGLVTQVVHLAFSEPIVGEIVVDVRDKGVGPLRGRAGLVTQVVHLLRIRVTTDAKERTLSRRLKKDGPWLLRVDRIVHLQPTSASDVHYYPRYFG